MPDSIANAPTLEFGLRLFSDAFHDLNSDRSFGMSMGPIPRMAMIDYCKAYELDDEATEDLIYFVSAMDQLFLKRQADKAKKK